MIPQNFIHFMPKPAQDYYKAVYEDSLARTGDSLLASKVAWNMVKMRLKFREDGTIEAMEIDFIDPKLISMPMEPVNEVLVQNSANGEIELDAVLATTERQRKDGGYYTEVELEQLAAQINAEGSSLPDIEHEVLENLKRQYNYNPELVANAIKRGEKGLFKTITATVRDGRLWIKAFLDKRYKNHVDKFKFLSIEALSKRAADGRLFDPLYLGFTFTGNPQLAGAGIAQ